VDPRGFPTTLPEFQRVFPDDRACATYLEHLRWADGFACPKCGVIGEPYRFAARPGVLRCRDCKSNVSLTAKTVMDHTHTPLSVWFWASYLVTTQTPGQSAVQFQRQLGLTRYETAYQILHKLKAWILGTHHGVSQQHLQAYLSEYTFRFNRRFYPMTAFNSLLGLGVKTIPPTYASLYSGVWEHPGGQPKSPQIEMPFA
jgi:predicted RNA-binding Zn-ribbon protein involved in translation (DUF1610 family)